MDLRNLITRRTDLARLSRDLDEIGHFARVWSARQWTRGDMAILWEAAKGFRAVTLDDFVPPSTPPLVEVVHEGKTSHRLYSHFQGRFCRPSAREHDERILGYCDLSLLPLIGPGYCIVRPSAEVGEVDIDHTVLPDEKPEQWPEIVDNGGGLGRLVYDGRIDVMRGLSTHATIGRGKKKGLWRDDWFILLRHDVPIGSS